MNVLINRWFRLIALELLLFKGQATQSATVVLDKALHHLGTPGEPEWQEFARDRAEGRSLELRFRALDNLREAALLIRQRDVKLDWNVSLNGRSIGRLYLMEADLQHVLTLPAHALRDGENVLAIGPLAGQDDIIVGELKIDPGPIDEGQSRAVLDIQVVDLDTQQDVPCRITVVDDRGSLAALAAVPRPRLALRPGVAYTEDGRVSLRVGPGRYTLHATRGFEYSLASRTVTVAAGQRVPVHLTIRREVPTPGLVACDTHVHTFTYSGHGDATVEERLVTLAGEGIELPIATDHNHLTDLRGTAEALGYGTMMTPVIGDEVTTPRGHFNAFPFTLDQPLPDATIKDWGRLMRAIRSGSDHRVTILNHPRDLHGDFRPFGPEHFNSVSGEILQDQEVGFDAVEVINSGAMQSDPMRVFQDWFALWNHGHRLTAIGASDSLDVSRYIVGQARTYIACPDRDPGRIDIAEACKSLRLGRAVVSLGLLTRIKVADRFGEGDLASGLGETFRVTVSVAGPSWIRADRVDLFANGVRVRERRLGDQANAIEKANVSWELPRPAYDVALVAIASGPGVTAPYWAIPKPYQPTSRRWEPRVLALTNPIRVDGDGDGRYSSPHEYAQRVIERTGTDPAKLLPALAGYDEAVAAQAAGLCRTAGQDVQALEFTSVLKTVGESVRLGFAAYQKTLTGAGRHRS
jgi:hypothetical protein